MEWLCRSVATVNSSWMEGGPNAVTEAILAGTPVLASRVEGNVFYNLVEMSAGAEVNGALTHVEPGREEGGQDD